ncbi:MAG: hypothetical protein AAGG01_11030, partial [Planctomycetota bacterium]
MAETLPDLITGDPESGDTSSCQVRGVTKICRTRYLYLSHIHSGACRWRSATIYSDKNAVSSSQSLASQRHFPSQPLPMGGADSASGFILPNTQADMLLAVSALALVPALPQTDWFVDDDATGPGTGTFSDPFPTIQAGIDAVTTLDGDTLRVRAGSYTEAVSLDGKYVNIVGDAPLGSVVLRRPTGAETALSVRGSGAAGIELSGLRFDGDFSTSGNGNGNGIHLNQGAQVQILGCEITDFGRGGEAAG